MTDTKQSEALRLADELDCASREDAPVHTAAIELRRLHEVNAELLEALKQTMTWIDNWSPEFTYDPDWSIDEDKARAAIAKAEVTK
jgi:hypothetical protein